MDFINLATVLDNQPFGTSIYDDKGLCIYCNTFAHRAHQLDKQVFLSTSIFNLFPEQTNLQSQFRELITGHIETVEFEVNNESRSFKVILMVDASGQIVASHIDITEQREIKQKLLVSAQNVKRLDDALTGANIGCWDFFPKQGKIVVNKAWVTQKKYQDSLLRKENVLFSELINGLEKWGEIIHPDDLDSTMERIQQHLDGNTDIYDAKFRMKYGDGQWHWIHDRGRVFERGEDGEPIRMNGVHIDITEAKQLENRILELLNIDVLTKVNSRRSFKTHFYEVLNKSNRDNRYLAFLLLDIDYFKLFNDNYGHLEGDHSLTAIGEEINKSLKREDDTCFRLGGEEFAVIYQVDCKKSAVQLAHTIKDNIESLKIPHKLNTASPYLTVSMGLWCDKTNENIDIDEIYTTADELLYQAKSSGRNNVKVSQ